MLKTHYIVFKPGRKVVLPTEKLFIDNQVIDKKETTTYFGVKTRF